MKLYLSVILILVLSSISAGSDTSTEHTIDNIKDVYDLVRDVLRGESSGEHTGIALESYIWDFEDMEAEFGSEGFSVDYSWQWVIDGLALEGSLEEYCDLLESKQIVSVVVLNREEAVAFFEHGSDGYRSYSILFRNAGDDAPRAQNWQAVLYPPEMP